MVSLTNGRQKFLDEDGYLVKRGPKGELEQWKKEDSKKGYTIHAFSVASEGYDKPIQLLIGIPRKKCIDPEAEEQEKREWDLSAFEHELQRFQRILPELMKTYPHQFVALLNGEVVDYDKDELELAKRVYSKYKSEFVLVREVKTEVPVIFALESPEGVVR